MKSNFIKEKIKKLQEQMKQIEEKENKEVGILARRWFELGAKNDDYLKLKDKILAVFEDDEGAKKPKAETKTTNKKEIGQE